MIIELAAQIEALDTGLFSYLEAQIGEWDRRALLALHSAAAAEYGTFAYLEVGSFRGGSLQAIMRDPRCLSVVSIDARIALARDAWGQLAYDDNTTKRMLELLRTLPGVDMGKLLTLEATTAAVPVADLPARPAYCFVDGEHTHDAVLRDARFCAEAMNGEGVIVFHDYPTVGSAISTFLAENWREISFALAFSGPARPSDGGGVFALELGAARLLETRGVERAVGSAWHWRVWRLVNRSRVSAVPFQAAWAVLPAIDTAVSRYGLGPTAVQLRHGFRRYLRRDSTPPV